jgi:hypothetical protein
MLVRPAFWAAAVPLVLDELPDPLLPQAVSRLSPAQMAANATVFLRFIRLTRLLVGNVVERAGYKKPV